MQTSGRIALATLIGVITAVPLGGAGSPATRAATAPAATPATAPATRPAQHSLAKLIEDCRSFKPPAAWVAYEEDEPVLLHMPTGQFWRIGETRYRPVKPWTALNDALPHRDAQSVFVGCLDAPDGAVRLVAMKWVMLAFKSDGCSRALRVQVLKPMPDGSLRDMTVEAGGPEPAPQAPTYWWSTPGGTRLTLFSPTVDAKDRTRVEIPYDVSGQPGIIDGWIDKDGLFVMKIRSGGLRAE